MPYLIGTDEAGYAPNLGPLVISATVWHVEDHASQDDLYKRLRAVVCKSPSRKQPLRRLAIGDSKLLYRPPHGLSLLERGVLAALGALDCFPLNWDEIWQSLDIDSGLHLGLLPWHVDYCLKLPLEADGEDLRALVPKLRGALARAGVRLVA